MDALKQHTKVLISGFSYADAPAWDFHQPLYAAEATKVEALKNLPAENSYDIQYYDLLTLTALAIEKGCSTDAAKWIPAMREVAMGPGTECYSYGECLKLIRAGQGVDYSGVPGGRPRDGRDVGTTPDIASVRYRAAMTRDDVGPVGPQGR
jgi:hypothetical protein